MRYLIPDSDCTTLYVTELHDLDSACLWVNKLNFICVAFNVCDSNHDGGDDGDTATKD